MSSNPMQRKVRNSFLLGVLSVLIIVGLVGGIVYLLIIKPDIEKKKEEEAQKGEEVIVYTLNQDLKSGDIITEDMLIPITVYKNTIPANYANSELLSTMKIQDEYGNIVYIDNNQQLYMYYSENNGKYITINNKEENVNNILIQQDELGYYRTKKTDGSKEYIKLIEVPTIAKVDLKKNTIVTTSMIAKADQITTDSLRYVEYNMISMPTVLSEGDYVDIRIRIGTAQDLIVIPKKQIVTIYKNTIGFNLTEEEIVILNSAIVENYIMTSSELYVASYIEPGLQKASTYTYMPTEEVINLINMDENIVNVAKTNLAELYSKQGVRDVRGQVNNTLSAYSENARENLEIGIRKQIQSTIEARENYLSEMEGY